MDSTQLRVSTSAAQVILPGDRSAVIGRGRDADIVIIDGRVSRRHIVLEPHPNGWMVRDASSSGVWHGGRQVATLHVRDVEVRLRLGAPNGPEVALIPQRPAGRPPGAPGIDEAATALAAQGPAGLRNRGPAYGGSGMASGYPQEGTAAPIGAARGDSVAAASGGGDASAQSETMRWLRSLPTLAWLAATAFAIGALIALS